MQRIVALVLLGAGTLALPAPARAQIVNVLPAISDSGEEGFSASISGSLVWKTGNLNLLNASSGVAAAYRAGDNTAFLILKATYAARTPFGPKPKKDESNCTDDEPCRDVYIQNTFEHLRYRRRLHDKVGVEVFAQHVIDQIRRIKQRALAGAGPRLTLEPTAGFGISVGTAYMLEYEETNVVTGSGEVQLAIERNHRSSSYLQLTVATEDNAVSFGSTTFFQPRFGRPRDYRLLNQSALVLKVNDWISVRVALNLAYDNKPPPLVDEVDTALESSLVLTF